MANKVESQRIPLSYPRECTFSENDWAILANMWYPLALESDLSDGPKQFKLLDVDLVGVISIDVSRRVVETRSHCTIYCTSALSLGWTQIFMNQIFLTG